jgi:hypothetical protein
MGGLQVCKEGEEMNIIYNEENYIEFEVDGEVWGYVLHDIDVRPVASEPMPVFLTQDSETFPYAYWAWDS